MRTKHILTAMVLPALFAACTADEFVENGGNVSLEGRELLKSFPISVEGAGVDTRFAWDEEAAGGIGNWAWENTDAFSAFLVNNNAGEKPETWIPTDQLLTNYIYTSEDGASYTTTSAMVEGLYWFYAPARTSQGVGSSSLMSFDLATAQNKDYWKSDAAKVFITPLYRLVAGNEPNNLALNLMNYYSRAVFPLTNNTDKTVTIRQIVLESSNDLVVKGEISVEAIKNYMYAFNEAGELVSVNNLDKVTTNDETNKKLRARLAEADLVKDNDKKVKTKVLVLNLGDGVAITKGATESFTMLVPRTNASTTCTVKIITNQGVVEVNADDQSNYARNVQFKHNGVMPMFGLASDNSFKAYSIEEEKFTDLGDARYVGSYDEMIALINTVNGKFSVYNMGDWKVDAAMAKALEKSDSYVNFLQPITIEDTEEEVKLTKVSFGRLGADEVSNTVTIAKGTKVSFNASDRNDTENAVVGNMNIEEGAEVVLNDGDFTKAAINNAGALTVNAGADFGTWVQTNTNKIESVGALTIVGNTEVGAYMKGGSMTLATPANQQTAYSMMMAQIALPTTDDLEKNGNATLTVNEGVTLNVNAAERAAESYKDQVSGVTYSVAVVNNGTISISNTCTFTTKGSLTNNGEISGQGTLAIEGTATNAEKKSIATTLTIAENAQVNNNGDIEGTTVTNYGTIVAGANSYTKVTAGTGVVNNTALGDVNNADNNKVTYEITDDMDSKALKDLLDKLNEYYSINKLVVKSTLTIDEASTSIDAAYTEIDFEDGSMLRAVEAGALTVNAATVNVNGDVTFRGMTGSTFTFNEKTTNTLTVKKNSALTIERCKIAGNATKELTIASENLAADDDPKKTVRGQVYVNSVTFENANNEAVSSEEWWHAN